MKYILVVLISFYQLVVSPLLKSILGVPAMCRYTPSCSEYAKRQIKNHGIFIGGYRSVLRLLSCQPFVKQRIHTV